MKLARGLAVFLIACLVSVLAIAILSPSLLVSPAEWRDTAEFVPELVHKLGTPDGRDNLRDALHYTDSMFWIAWGAFGLTLVGGVAWIVRRRRVRAIR